MHKINRLEHALSEKPLPLSRGMLYRPLHHKPRKLNCHAQEANEFCAMSYSKTTEAIEVSVTPIYLEDESRPSENHFFWAYRVQISNHSAQSVKLLTRYWHIVDGFGRVEEVHGDGVVGEQPVIKPGGSYHYTSGCPLPTPHGIMSGHYTMRNATGQLVRIDIPAFSLDTPDARRSLN
jgi:ApaG protein